MTETIWRMGLCNRSDAAFVHKEKRMKLLLRLRKRHGLKAVEYLDESGRSVVEVPAEVWRARPEIVTR
jgi:hypothetical protein